MAGSEGNRFKYEITCPVCMDIFDDPHQMECLHTFCLQCIGQMQVKRTVKCPVCRLVTYPNNLKKDFKIQNFIEIYVAEHSVEGKCIMPDRRKPQWQKKEIQKIQKGTHISYWCNLYYRHAIVVKPWQPSGSEEGQGHIVIIAWRMVNKEIVEESVKLKRGCKVHVAVYDEEGCFDAEMVVYRARRRLGETSYNVINNYARAFPRWCVTGYGGIFTDI